MKHVITIIMTLAITASSHAFVLVGPADPAEQTLAFGGTPVTSANISDELGGPKQLDEFFRWNCPDLTYGFDQSFIQFFGQEGINAVDDAMRSINDYFLPEDGSYAGVSSLNLAKHGFGRNYNTAWLNATAANENLIDLKSLTLGMMVNYLGLGNPYRYAFTATNSLVPNQNASGAIFSVVLKNYDPVTYSKSDTINGVKYSYRLIHDRPPGSVANAATVGAMSLDMEEFTSDSSGNAYSAVSAIVDAFYGNTDLVWTDVPSLYNFGVYYDGMNAMGGMYQPRHALTHDDAGGLKYLYSTNTIAMEYNPYTLISPADFTAPVAQYGLPPSGSEIVNRAAGIFPTRNGAGLPNTFSSTHPLANFSNPAGIAGVMSGGTAFWGANVGKMDWAYRGGVDRVQFHPVSFDSLLLMNHFATNYIWTDTFMTNAQIQQQVASTALNTTPGASVALTDGRSHYFQQVLGRDVAAPDFLFTAAGLGAAGGVPVAFQRSTFTDQGAPAVGTPAAGATRFNATSVNILQEIPVGASGPGTLASGPGAGGSSFLIEFNNAFAVGGFEVVWNGELSVVGDMAVPTTSQMWAYIKGPGPNDLVRFPDGSFSTLVQNTILPVEGVPEISLVSDDGGQTQIEENSFTRTTEQLTILGKNFRDATALEIISDNESIIQLIYPLTDYIMDDGRIEIPTGIIGYDAEGANRRVRVWNTLGQSEPSEEKFSVITGPPMVTSTTFDGLAFDRAEPLTITGVGFKSRQVGLASTTVQYRDGNSTITNIRIDTAAGDNLDDNASGLGLDLQSSLTVLSDTRAILAGNALGAWADGAGRTLRVNRGTTDTQSAAPTSMFTVISTQPNVTALNLVNLATEAETAVTATEALQRDSAISIEGVGLNTATQVEIVRENGTSYNPPITAFFTEADIDDNGTKLRLGKYAFVSTEADGYGVITSKLKVTNLFGSDVYSVAFQVNTQPNDGTVAENETISLAGMRGGAAYGIQANLWDRTMATGEDLTFIGAGLKAISSIEMVDNAGASLSPVVKIDLNPLGTPGVTVTDTLIQIDTSLAQFTDVNGSDNTDVTTYRRFKLVTARNDLLTEPTVGQRFLVGRPPAITILSLQGGDNHWNRDANATTTDSNATVLGYGLGLVTSVEMLDGEGSVVAANTALGLPFPDGVSGNSNVGLTFSDVAANDWDDRLELNATIWSVNGNLLDSSQTASRRIRITTPFGSVLSDDNSSGTFTFSANPDLAGADTNATTTGAIAVTYAGGGFNGIDTYDYNTTNPTQPNYLNVSNAGTWQDLVINGQNFLSVKTLVFLDSTVEYDGGDGTGLHEVDLNPRNPPAGITFAADGSRITVSGSYLYQNANSSWLNSGATAANRFVRLHTANNDDNSTAITTPLITIDPTWNDSNP